MTAAPNTLSPLAALAWAAAATLYSVLFLGAESERALGTLLVIATSAVVLGARFGLVDRIRASIGGNERAFDIAAVAGVLIVGLWFHEEHFIILMMTTALLLMVAALGLTIQFGYAGVVNFAGAAFLGIGCYTAGVVTKYTALPSFLTLPLGGLMAAIIGSILILPVLRTRGHYAALVTIAFGILFKVFLEVNDTLGGPQGIQVKPIVLFGWNFNSPIRIGDFTASFYFSYLLLALLLLVLSFALVRRLERSWIGLSLDAIRLDEIASACYGLNLARWKVLAFTLGNFLILVSIILLGGLGNLWGVAVAAAFVVILPEKFQVIQEYRLVLYAALVILILLFRPEGLLPRQLRDYVPGAKPQRGRSHAEERVRR